MESDVTTTTVKKRDAAKKKTALKASSLYVLPGFNGSAVKISEVTAVVGSRTYLDREGDYRSSITVYFGGQGLSVSAYFRSDVEMKLVLDKIIEEVTRHEETLPAA